MADSIIVGRGGYPSSIKHSVWPKKSTWFREKRWLIRSWTYINKTCRPTVFFLSPVSSALFTNYSYARSSLTETPAGKQKVKETIYKETAVKLSSRIKEDKKSVWQSNISSCFLSFEDDGSVSLLRRHIHFKAVQKSGHEPVCTRLWRHVCVPSAG